MNTDDASAARPSPERATALAQLRQILADVTASPTLHALVRGSLQIALIQLSNTPGPPPALRPPTPSKDAREDLQRVLSILSAEIAAASSSADSVRLGKASRHVHAALAEMGDNASPASTLGQP